MSSQEPFKVAADKIPEQLLHASIAEANDKITRLKNFYKNPYGDGSERWWLAGFCLDYAAMHKDGKTRKDKITADILHELNQIILQQSLVNGEVLPRKVTYEIIDGKRIDIPEAKQSMERLFCATAIHDIDEDFHKTSVYEFIQYINERIKLEKDIPDNIRKKLLGEVGADGVAMWALTFGRKTCDNNDKEIEVETFGGDRNLYMDELETYWVSIAMKATDRLDSLTSRYGDVDRFFTIGSDVSHIDETNRLFRLRQTFENAADRFPEMSEYFNSINAKLDVASKCLECITLFHPSKGDKKAYAETAKIDLSRLLPEAVKHCEYLDKDSWMLERMIRGFEKEVERHPELANIVGQIREQYEEALSQHLATVNINNQSRTPT